MAVLQALGAKIAYRGWGGPAPDPGKGAAGWAAVATPGIVIRDPECVLKSFPGFWELLESFGVRAQRLS